MNESAKRLLCTYIQAKDGNRPHLLRQVFAKDAVLDMDVRTEGMRFPAQVSPGEAIADVLVRQFCATYENIYTFYLAEPPTDAKRFRCSWFVGMTEKASGKGRVGSGRYDWRFSDTLPLCVTQLGIRIDVMETLSPFETNHLLGWLSNLPYPWCAPRALIASAPRICGLQKAIVDFLPECEVPC